MNNPDGAELFHKTAQTNRSNVRPHDTDRDSLLDEGPGEDLNGDGYIREMRENVGEGKGNAILDPRDKTGRLMKKVPDGDWMVYPEGLDDDLDGKYNEDGIGGLDLHRNYLKNWRPEPAGAVAETRPGVASHKEPPAPSLCPNPKPAPSSCSCSPTPTSPSASRWMLPCRCIGLGRSARCSLPCSGAERRWRRRSRPDPAAATPAASVFAGSEKPFPRGPARPPPARVKSGCSRKT